MGPGAPVIETQQQSRLRWRCRRGMRELDILLMRYLDEEYSRSSAMHRDAFERLLCLQDPEILELLTQRTVAQDSHLRDVVERLLGSH